MKTLNMHKYIVGWVVLMAAFGITFPIAMFRVSQSDKFIGQSVKSLDCDGKFQATQAKVVSWVDTCRNMRGEPLKTP
jgi:hypothetical protein